eukprot:gene1019-340_t
MAVCETICHFNNGPTTKCDMVSLFGVQPGTNMEAGVAKLDKRRIKNAAVKISPMYRQKRRKRRANRKNKGGDKPIVYQAGAFGFTSEHELMFGKKKEKRKAKTRTKIGQMLKQQRKGRVRRKGLSRTKKRKKEKLR